MRLHWSPRSPFVRKVMVSAHELGLADQIVIEPTVVAMTKPNLSLLADNPLGKIPTLLLDDGTVLYDSLVICEYLDALAGDGLAGAGFEGDRRAGPRLFPATGPARWTALTWHALGDGLMDTLVLWRNERDKPQPRQTQEWLAAFELKTGATLGRIGALVPALDAAPFGIGHIAIGCALSYLDFRFAGLRWRDGCDGLAAWHAAFEARPSVRATQVVDA